LAVEPDEPDEPDEDDDVAPEEAPLEDPFESDDEEDEDDESEPLPVDSFTFSLEDPFEPPERLSVL
jgi:hypothetical protein